MFKLRNHLVGRLRNPDYADDGTRYSTEELGHIHIVSDRIYEHKTMRLNYTTYDMRRDYDIVNPRTHADIMAVSPAFDDVSGTSDDGHPFVYARILGIFHAEVIYTAPGQETTAHTMEFLFVRWYERDLSFPAGFQQRRLHRITFMAPTDPNAYGFLDPDDVIRSSHIIPAFAHGKYGPTTPQPLVEHFNFSDWKYHYVNL